MGSNEIDKESMFQKIMPSAKKNKASTKTVAALSGGSLPLSTPPEQKEQTNPSIENVAAANTAEHEEPAAGDAAEKTAPEPEALDADSIPNSTAELLDSLPDSPLPPMEEALAMQQAMIQPETDDVFPSTEEGLDTALHSFAKAVEQPDPPARKNTPQPVNVVELLVERYYPRYQHRLSGCECQRCRDDVCGMALNKIKPRYITSNELSEENLLDRDLVAETVTALVRAIFIVKRNPHHDDFGSVRF